MLIATSSPRIMGADKMMTQEAPEENKYISTGYWGVALEKFVDPSKTVCVVWRPFCPKGIPRVRVINCEENKEFNNRDELQAFIAKLNLAADQAWPHSPRSQYNE